MDYEEDPPAATHGWTCQLCRWSGRSDSKPLMDLKSLIDHGVRYHYIQQSQFSEFANNARLEDRSPRPSSTASPSRFGSYSTMPSATAAAPLGVPRYDQREQFMQGPPVLNQTFEPLVEITNRPYHNPHQKAYQSTYQNTFHNTYQNIYENTDTYENAYELINEGRILGDFDYTINKIHGAFENEGVQLGKTRESPFMQHFQANVGQVQQSRTTNFAPPSQEPTIKQDIQRVRQQRSEGESPRRNEMESCEWEAEFFDFEAATQYQ